MILSTVLAIILVVAVIFNQETYYVTGDTLDSSGHYIEKDVLRVAYHTSIYLTYLIFVAGWIMVLYYIISEEIDAFKMPLTWALLSIGFIMFCGIMGTRTKENDYAWGTALSIIDLVLFIFFFILNSF